ncbi:Protein of unknown function [Cotesia congregata]|uniref:Uncharacterized protein n=1 Tax=Cotesia congregata TaxID=51543 RepID=A0A8J2HBI5_COTCN|nr:Protein of unknown function [Cotesia congregata]
MILLNNTINLLIKEERLLVLRFIVIVYNLNLNLNNYQYEEVLWPANRQVTKDFLTDIFTNKRLPKPLRIRVQKYKEELSFKFPKIATRSLGYYPPWYKQNINFNLTMCDFNRSTTTAEMYRNYFLTIQEQYKNFEEYYTDGSVIENCAGFAVTTENNILHFYRLFNCSI